MRDLACEYSAIFFDLDGTLLPMEMEHFLKEYFSGIARFVYEHGGDPEAFSDALQLGTHAMGSHDASVTNEQAFWSEFSRHMDMGERDWEALCIEYYNGPFRDIGKSVQRSQNMLDSVEVLSSKGYPLALATMPYFPEIAVEARLDWAGVGIGAFEFATNYSNSHHVKPHIEFYEECLSKMALQPEEVLMVGNNTLEDGVAASIGMDVYLITDHLLNPNGADLDSFAHGTSADFLEFARRLPDCRKRQ